jgi:hypothetical protein
MLNLNRKGIVVEFSVQELRLIVAQASTLEQRLQGEFLPDKALDTNFDTEDMSAKQVDDRLQRWQKTINGPLFEKRLAWEGYHLESVREVLGNVCLPDTADLPDWAFTLNALLASVPQNIPAYRFISDTDPVAFESIVAPFVQFGSTKIAGTAGWELLSTGAQIDLERDLLKMFSWRMMRAFDAEFK